MGYDSLWVNDHLLSRAPWVGLNFPYFECWRAITALVRDTNRVKIGSLASCHAFRHPSVMTKTVATLDNMNKGRIIPVFGACSYEGEFQPYGIRLYSHGERVDRLREYLQILKKIWTEMEPFFNGRYYQIKGASGNPESV